MMLRLLAFVLVILVVSSCGKKEENTVNPPISDVPEVSIEKIEPMSIDQFESLHFEISYIDGDGDIGTEDADDHSLEIVDQRDNIIHTFHVPPQSPGSGISISGVFAIELENVILLDQSNSSEEILFSVRLKDRAENWSNTVTSDPVTVNK